MKNNGTYEKSETIDEGDSKKSRIIVAYASITLCSVDNMAGVFGIMLSRVVEGDGKVTEVHVLVTFLVFANIRLSAILRK